MTNNSSSRRGLGRGLGALIVNTEENPASAEVLAQADAGGVRLVDVAQIQPNPHQPRSKFDVDLLQELADSIGEHGIIQPLIVTAATDARNEYWLVAGERRWRAARLAGLAQVPVIVREATPQQLMEWALVENVQRADLNALEEAAAYAALVQEFNLTQAEVAQRIGKSRSAVANTLRLLQLPPRVQTAVIDGEVTAGHARALLALPDDAAMEAALERIVRNNLNVRQTEELIRHLVEAGAAEKAEEETVPPQETDADRRQRTHLRHLEDQLRSALGTRVNLNRNADGTGRLVIHFFNDDDLDMLYQRMVGSDEL